MININVESCVDSDTFCQRLCIYYVVLLELAVMREVSVLMGFRFPNMFQDKGSTGTVITRIFFVFDNHNCRLHTWLWLGWKAG